MKASWITLVGAVIFVLIVSFHSTMATLVLAMAEEDISVAERTGRVQLAITSEGETDEPVTIEVVPVSVEQYRVSMGGAVALDNHDPATPDVDFNATVQQFQIMGERGDIAVTIPIIDDTVSENEEVFVVVLRVVAGSNVRLERPSTTVYIRRDSEDATIISFNMKSLVVDEGVGVVNETVFLEIQGMAEPALVVNVELSSPSDDLTLLVSTVTIPSGASRASIPFQITDDNMYEGTEDFRLSLSQPPQFSVSQLYHLDASNLKLTIKDNDVAKIGIEVSGNKTSLMEGESTQVCVRFLGPSALATLLPLQLEQTPKSITDIPHVVVLGGIGLVLFTTTELEHCLNVTVSEDEDITPSWTLTFGVEQFSFGNNFISNDDDSIVFEPQLVELLVLDNDGVPQTPANVQTSLINEGQDLLIDWESSPTPLRPVQQYVVEVQVTPPLIPRVSRRQAGIDDNSMQRYITMETEVVVPDIDRDMEYKVRVCAENWLGRSCEKPVQVYGRDLKIDFPSVGGVLSREESLPVWVYVVAGVGLVLLCAVMVCLLGVCVCWRLTRMKSYYPSKQEVRINKMRGSEERYTVRYSSGSCSEWESSSGGDLQQSV